MTCPDEDLLAALTEGAVSRVERQDLEAHLEGCPDCLAVVCELGRTAPLPAEEATGAKEDWTRGTRIGRYTLLEMVGEGGMGTVFAAYDPQLDRRVALKLVRQDRALVPEIRARVSREARAMARLSHPHVVQVYDAGEEDGRVFLAMEFVDGVTLARWLEERERGASEVMAVLLAAGKGLAAAHAAGIVHRDFKPDNVLLATDGRVVVTDFGLARSPGELLPAAVSPGTGAREGDAALTSLTATGTILGTPRYMSPEQHAGGRVDARTDQFGFAVTAYQALYRELPFAGDTREALRSAVSAGRVRSARQGAKVDERVRQALLRALAVDPAARYPSLDALLADLAPRSSRRWPLLTGLTLAVAALAAPIVAFRAAGAARLPPCPDAAVKLAGVWDPPRKAAIAEAFRATGAPSAATAWSAVERTLDRRAAAWTASSKDACEATAVRHEQSSELLDARTACLSGRLDELRALTDVLTHPTAEIVQGAAYAAEGLPPLSPCDDPKQLLARVKPPADPQVRARVDELHRRLDDLRAAYLTDHAHPLLTETIAVGAEARATGYLPVSAEASLLLGWEKMTLHDVDGADASFLRAELDAESAGDDHVRGLAFAGRVYIYGLRGEDARTETLRGEADALAARLGDDDQAVERLFSGAALILDSADRSEEACAYWRKALARNEKLRGPDSFAVGVNLENLAASETIVGDFAAAVADDERALAIFEHTPGAESKDIALGEASLADIFVEELRPHEAEAPARKAAGIWKDLAPRSFEYAQSEEILGAALLDEGRFADAREAYETAAAARDMDEKKDPFVVLTLLGLGAAHLGLGDAAGALAPLERAVRVESSGVKLEVAACKLLLGEALARTSGDRARARKLVTEARAVYTVSGKGPRHDRDLAAMDAWLAANTR